MAPISQPICSPNRYHLCKQTRLPRADFNQSFNSHTTALPFTVAEHAAQTKCECSARHRGALLTPAPVGCGLCPWGFHSGFLSWKSLVCCTSGRYVFFSLICRNPLCVTVTQDCVTILPDPSHGHGCGAVDDVTTMNSVCFTLTRASSPSSVLLCNSHK